MGAGKLFPFYIRQALDDVGDGTGNTNMNQDYSSTPTEFRIVAPPGRDIELYRMTIEIASPSLQRCGYGDLSVALTNGISLAASEKDPTTLLYGTFLEFGTQIPLRVTTMAGWSRLGGEFTMASPTVYFEFDFRKMFGHPIVLRGNREGKLLILLRDNMSTGGANLSRHFAFVSGRSFPNLYLSAGLAGN